MLYYTHHVGRHIERHRPLPSNGWGPGGVSASHSIGDKSVVCDDQQIVLNNNREREQPRYSLFTVRDTENAMVAFTIFAIAVIVGIFLYEIVLKRNNIVSALSAVVVNVSSVLSAATLLTILLEGFDVMFFRRTRKELTKLRKLKAEIGQLEELKKENEELRQEVSKLNNKPSANSSKPKDAKSDK